MKWSGYRQVQYKAVTMDVADVRARSKAAHVAALAANNREHGDEPRQAPTVEHDSVCATCALRMRSTFSPPRIPVPTILKALK
jgi:hypothetical protein